MLVCNFVMTYVHTQNIVKLFRLKRLSPFRQTVFISITEGRGGVWHIHDDEFLYSPKDGSKTDKKEKPKPVSMHLSR